MRPVSSAKVPGRVIYIFSIAPCQPRLLRFSQCGATETITPAQPGQWHQPSGCALCLALLLCSLCQFESQLLHFTTPASVFRGPPALLTFITRLFCPVGGVCGFVAVWCMHGIRSFTSLFWGHLILGCSSRLMCFELRARLWGRLLRLLAFCPVLLSPAWDRPPFPLSYWVFWPNV